MGRATAAAEAILRTPLHRLLSGSRLVISFLDDHGDDQTVMVQYADAHHGLVVVVNDEDSGSWWQQFDDMGQVRVLWKGTWTPMTAHTLRGADDPAAVTPLLRSYAKQYPDVVKSLGGDNLEERVAHTVVVWLRPATH